MAFLALAGGILYFLASPRFERFASDYLVDRIEERTGAVVTLQRLDADLVRWRFVLEGLVLRGDEDRSGRPLVSVARIEADVSWRGLLKRSLDLTRVSVSGPEIFLVFDETGRTNVPGRTSSGSGSAPAFGFSIDEFEVSGGSLVVNERRIDVDFDLASLEGEFAYSEPTGVLSSHVEYDGEIVRAGGVVISYSLSADFDYTRGTVLVERAELRSGASDLSLQGRIDNVLSDRQGQMAYTGTVDLEFLDYFLAEADAEGTLAITGDLEFANAYLRTSGRAQSEQVTVENWWADNVQAAYAYAFPEQVLEVDSLETRVLGGEARGGLTVSAGPRVVLDLEYQDIDTAALRQFYPWDTPYVVTSRARGTAAGWFEGRLDRFEFAGEAVLDPASGGAGSGGIALPLAGTTAYRVTPGSVEVTGLEAGFRSSGVTADGSIGSEALNLAFTLESENFEDFAFLTDFARGAGRIEGVLRGRIDDPEVAASFRVVDYSYREWVIDRLEGAAVLGSGVIDLDAVRVVVGDSEVRVSGRTDANLERPDLQIDVVRLGGGEIRSIVDRPVDGIITGEVHLESIDPLRFDARLESRAFSYDSHPLGSVDAAVSFGSEAWRVESFEMRRGVASVSGDFLFEPSTRALAGNLTLSGYRFEDLAWLGVPEGVGGSVGGASFVVGGTLDVPRVEGRGVVQDFGINAHAFPEAVLVVRTEGRRALVDVEAGPELQLEAEVDTAPDNGYPFQGTARFANFTLDPVAAGLGATSLTATGSASFEGRLADLATLAGVGEVAALTARVGDRTLSVSRPFTIRFDSERVALSPVELSGGGTSVMLEGNIDVSTEAAALGYPFEASARFVDFAPGEFVGLAADTVELTGSASFGGRLRNLAATRGVGEVTALTLLVGDRTLRVSEPFTVDFDANRVRVSSIRVRGNVTSVAVEGTVGMSAGTPLDLSAAGTVDLSLLAGAYAGLDTGGIIVVDGRIGGTLASPELSGVATLEDVSVAHEGLFLSLTSVSGGMFFEGNRVNLTNVNGSAGGGRVALRGDFGVESTGLADFDIRLDASNVRVRTPDGVRTVFNGALALGGTPESPSLEGNLQVVDFSFNGDFESFLGMFGGRGPGFGAPEEAGPLDRLGLAVHIDGDRNIRIENELASVEARLDLDIGGTFNNPTLTGHIETTSGNLNFQSTRYRITRGSVDFVDPLGIEPLIDVQAEADLRDYRIILVISGRGDDVRLDMRSDPPLSQLEIVSLVAGGRTREELAASGSDAGLVPSSEQLFTGGAATILSDLLQERVGSRLGLLGRVRIDPFLVGAENDPVTRVTISERITRDLAITYSQDLSSNSQQVILIEYFLSSDTSIIASRDETGALGVDIRLRKRFP